MANENERVLPYLSKTEIEGRDAQEKMLSRDLSGCWRGDEFDIERAEHLINAALIAIFDVEYEAYRQKTGYKTGWIEEIVYESIFRVVRCADNVHWDDGPALLRSLNRTLMHHLEHDSVLGHGEFEAAFPEKKRLEDETPKPLPVPPPPLPPDVQGQMARAGIDVSSTAPLLKMALAAPIPTQKTPVEPSAKDALKAKRKSLLDSYREKFPDVKLADIMWAANQTRREWTRWLGGEAKDGLKADRCFSHVLRSGKTPEQIKGKPRPTKYTV